MIPFPIWDNSPVSFNGHSFGTIPFSLTSKAKSRVELQPKETKTFIFQLLNHDGASEEELIISLLTNHGQ